MKILRKICIRQHLFSTIFVFLLTLLVVSFSLPTFLVPHAEAAEDYWATKAQMPTARAGFGVAEVNGKVYAIGGSNGSWLNTNEEYDPATDTWTTKTPMPTKRGYVAASVYQNKIYVIGGDSHESSPSGKTEVYDPATDTWETKTSMPTPRVNLCANGVNGKLYLIGGNTFNALAWPVLSNKTEVYDPSTDSWTTKASMPNFEGLGFADIASAVVNNKIYVIGGEEWAITDLNQIYDPETDAWSSGISMPTAVEGPAVGATTGVFAPKRIHVLSMDLHQVYNPDTDVWSTGTQMPTPRRHLGVAVINDRLYAIGGGFSGDVGFIETNENEQYTPSGYGQALGTIYIRSDGSVDPGTAPIQRNGDVYAFTGNINIDSGDCGIEVDRDNIVVDGAGYTLQGTRSGTGISLTGRTNVTIKNVQIRYFSVGIALDSSYHNAISGNNLTHNGYQASIFVFGKSSNNKINNNNIEANDVNGIWLNYSSDNTISENRIRANGFEGIMVSGGLNNRISGNVIEKNDGDGIYLSADSSGTTVTENNITENNPNGILLIYSSGNTISKNNLENNYRGVYLDASSKNTIVGNKIKGNGRAGIEAITTSSNNKIYHNNFVENAKQVLSTNLIGVWDNGKEGNYWSNYNGTDANGDGIGDIPYVIDENNQDNYPLLHYWDSPTQNSSPFSTTWILAAIMIIAVAGAALLVYFANISKTTGGEKRTSPEGLM